MSILSTLINSNWAIEENSFRKICEVVDKRKFESYRLTAEDKKEIEAGLGFDLGNNGNGYQVREGKAIIPVMGAIVQHGDMFSEVSGLTSVDRLTKDFKKALNDDQVKEIIFKIDSPGGEAHGISEFADLIYNARDQKPTTAYISGMGCSAAYWISAMCSKIVCADTAELGSVGVMVTYFDDTEALKKAGYKERKFISSYSKNKNKDIKTTAGEEALMKRLDDFCLVFIDKVAKGRGLSAKDVQVGFGEGSVYLGQECITRKLADEIGSFEELFNNGENMSTKNDAGKTSVEEKTNEVATVEDEGIEPVNQPKKVETITKDIVPTVSVEAFEAMSKQLEDLKKQNELNQSIAEKQAKDATELKKQILEKDAKSFQEDNKNKVDAKDVEALSEMYISLSETGNPETLGKWKAFIENLPVNSKYEDGVIVGNELADKYGKRDAEEDKKIESEVENYLKKTGKLKK